MCFPHGEFIVSDGDVHLGDLDVGLERQVPMYMSNSQFASWRYTHLTGPELAVLEP